MIAILDVSERQERLQAAIARYVAREIGEQEFRVELGRCGLTATDIDQCVTDNRKARRAGTRFA